MFCWFIAGHLIEINFFTSWLMKQKKNIWEDEERCYLFKQCFITQYPLIEFRRILSGYVFCKVLLTLWCRQCTKWKKVNRNLRSSRKLPYKRITSLWRFIMNQTACLQSLLPVFPEAWCEYEYDLLLSHIRCYLIAVTSHYSSSRHSDRPVGSTMPCPYHWRT